MKCADRSARFGRCLLGTLFFGALLLAPNLATAQEAKTPEKKEAAKPAAKSSDAAVRQYRAAVQFQNRGVFDLAATEWESFLKDFPKDPLAASAQHYLGVCQFQQKKYAEAEAEFAKVATIDPNYKGLNETLLNLGLAQYNLGQGGSAEAFDKAIATLQALLAKFPESKEAPHGLFYLAESLYARNKKPEAIAAYQQLLEKHPKHDRRMETFYGLGVAQEEVSQAEAAGKTYETLLKEFPESPYVVEVGMRRADTLVALGQHAEAEKRFAAAANAKDFPLADYALQRQALCNYELKKYPEAAALYAKLPEAFPKSNYVGLATLAAGKCYFLAGDLAQAREWLAKGTALGGDLALEGAHWLAQALLKEKKPAEALPAIEAALAKAGTSTWVADLKMDQADALYEIADRRNESIPIYAAIAKEFPQHAQAPQAGYMAAYASLGAGQYEPAIAHAKAFREAHAKHKWLADVLYVEAESLLQLRKYAEAEALYDQLLKEHAARPEAAQWTVRLALAQQLQKKHAEVVATLQPKLASLMGDSLAEAQFLIGGSQLEAKQPAEAVKSLEASLAAGPKWRQADETLLLLAAAQRQAGDLKGATASVTKLLADFPQSAVLDRANYRLAELLSAAEDYAAAGTTFQKVIDTWPKSDFVPFAFYELGWTQFRRNDLPAAIAAWSALVEKFPEHKQTPPARYARAVAQQQSKEYAKAIEDIEAYLKTEPKGAEKLDATFVLGQSQAGLEKFEDAAKTFEAILAADPKYADADKVVYELAWAQQSQKQADKAAATFARLATDFPKSPLAADSQFRVGEANYEQKQFDKAAVAFFASNTLAGKSELGEKASHMLAWSYFGQNDFAKAHDAFAFQLKTYPDGPKSADGQVMLGESLFKQNKHEEALAAFQKAIAMKPSKEDFEILALLHAGQSAGVLGKWEDSLKLLQTCTMKFPESAFADEARYEQGRALYKLEKPAEALKLFEAVAASGQTLASAKAEFMIGGILFEQKKHAEAVKVYFKVAYGYGYPNSPEAFHGVQADSTFEAARCLEVLGKGPQAAKLFQEVVEKYPQSDKAAAAKAKLEKPKAP